MVLAMEQKGRVQKALPFCPPRAEVSQSDGGGFFYCCEP